MKKIKGYDIFVKLICVILFGYSIFVGSPIRNNTNIINLIVLVIFFIYIIVKNRQYKIIKRKIDIYVIILLMTSYISLIFQNYTNLEATIEYIIKYTSIVGMYIIIRDIVIIDKKYINYIINTLLISGISIFILGLDNLTYNISKNIIEITNNVQVLNEDKRFLGIFGYANTTGILMLINSILSIAKYLESNRNKEKIFYSICLFINITTIILSYSRGTWVIALITYMIYLYIVKKQFKEYIELMGRVRYTKFII